MEIAAFYENIAQGAESLHIPVEEALKSLKEKGMTRVYLCDRTFYEVKDDLMPVLKGLGIAIEGFFSFGDYGHAPDSESYKELIHLAKDCGAGNVLIVPGMIGEDEKDQAEILVKNMIHAMANAAAYGKSQGVCVSMEDFDGLAAPFCSVKGLKAFMDAIPELYCSFDTGNFIMYHEDVTDAFELFKDRLCTIHMKDRSDTPLYPGDRAKVCADGVKKYPSPVGYGNIAIKEILSRLKEIGYPGNVIVEMMDCDGEHVLEGIEKSVLWLKEQIDGE